MECDLCKSTLQTPILRETKYWRTALNSNQDLFGKTIIVLRRHAIQATTASLGARTFSTLRGSGRSRGRWPKSPAAENA